MFENPGEKIQNFAKVMFWISVIGTVVLAFTFGWETKYYTHFSGSYRDFNAVYFFTILIAGSFSSYVSALFLVAFGELVENIRHIKDATAGTKLINENEAKKDIETICPHCGQKLIVPNGLTRVSCPSCNNVIDM